MRSFRLCKVRKAPYDGRPDIPSPAMREKVAQSAGWGPARQPFFCEAGERGHKAPDEGRPDSPSPAKREKVARSARRGRERSELPVALPGAGSSQKKRVPAPPRPHPPFGPLLPRAGEGLEVGIPLTRG